jgi:hypothetical protein
MGARAERRWCCIGLRGGGRTTLAAAGPRDDGWARRPGRRGWGWARGDRRRELGEKGGMERATGETTQIFYFRALCQDLWRRARIHDDDTSAPGGQRGTQLDAKIYDPTVLARRHGIWRRANGLKPSLSRPEV